MAQNLEEWFSSRNEEPIIEEEVAISRTMIDAVYSRPLTEKEAFSVVAAVPEIGWLVECFCRSPQPPGWRKSKVSAGDVPEYYNEGTGTTAETPASFGHFVRLAELVAHARMTPGARLDIARWVQSLATEAEVLARSMRKTWTGPHVDKKTQMEYYHCLTTGYVANDNPAAWALFVVQVAGQLLNSEAFRTVEMYSTASVASSSMAGTMDNPRALQDVAEMPEGNFPPSPKKDPWSALEALDKTTDPRAQGSQAYDEALRNEDIKSYADSQASPLPRGNSLPLSRRPTPLMEEHIGEETSLTPRGPPGGGTAKSQDAPPGLLPPPPPPPLAQGTETPPAGRPGMLPSKPLTPPGSGAGEVRDPATNVGGGGAGSSAMPPTGKPLPPPLPPAPKAAIANGGPVGTLASAADGGGEAVGAGSGDNGAVGAGGGGVEAVGAGGSGGEAVANAAPVVADGNADAAETERPSGSALGSSRKGLNLKASVSEAPAETVAVETAAAEGEDGEEAKEATDGKEDSRKVRPPPSTPEEAAEMREELLVLAARLKALNPDDPGISAEAVSIMQSIARIPATPADLKATNLGVITQPFKDHKHPKVKTMARRLRNSWKELLKK